MSADYRSRLQTIKLLILDVDGTLTNGRLYYGDQGEQFKAYHVHDGLGIHLLKQACIEVAVITAKKGDAVANRLKTLNIKHAYLGHHDKREAYADLKKTLNLQDHEIAYMGDDLPDLPILNQVGVRFAPKTAVRLILQQADYITKSLPGEGAVREVCELILEAQQKLEVVIQSYLN